jgi:hypothetical protein
MSNNVKAKKKRESDSQSSAESGLGKIVIAALGTIGVVGAAAFSNWDKIFPPAPVQTSQTISSSPVPSVPSSSPTTPVSPTGKPLTSASLADGVPSSQPIVPTQPTGAATLTTPVVTPTQPELSVPVRATTSPTSTTPKAEIVQPADGTSIERNVDVLGTFTGLADGDSVWVYVLPSGEGRFYPSKASYDPKSQTWQVPIVVGTVAKEAAGATFKIGVFTASSQHTKALISEGATGLRQLPDDVVSLKSVTVRRK